MTAFLERDARIEILPRGRYREAQVVLVMVFEMTDAWLARIRSAVLDSGVNDVRVVLVAESITEARRVRAEAFGPTCFLLRGQVPSESVVEAVLDHRGTGGEAAGPPHEAHAPHGKAPHPRELDVVRMLAEGLSTAEMAARLNYSQRTIKSIIRSMLERQGLRNRSHAVAHALRSKLL
ncbi:response regulator transcription factor [Streptomyces sp. NPDC054841]